MTVNDEIRSRSSGFVSPAAPAWFIAAVALAGGMLLTTAITVGTRHFYQEQVRQRFLWAASERANVLQQRFDEHVKDLDGLRRFLAKPGYLHHAEFSRYVAPLLDSSLAYSWIPRVAAGERAAFEAAARREGIAGYLIRDLDERGQLHPAAERAEYFPVLFVAASSINKAPIGLDLMSQPTRRETLARARASGQMAVSEPLHFPGVPEADATGLSLLAPIFDIEASTNDSVASPIGFVSAVFSLRRLMSEGSSPESDANLYLVLSRAEDDPLAARLPDAPLYRSPGQPAASTLHVRKSLAIADRRFRLDIHPTEAFLVGNRTPEPWLAMAAGTALSVLLSTLLYTLASQRRRAFLLVDESTAELRQRERELQESERRWQFALEGAGDGVWDWNLETGEIYHSAAWRNILGYSREKPAMTLAEWRSRLHPQDLEGCLADLQAHLRGETPDYRHEYRVRREDGGWLWILERGKVLEHDSQGAPKRMIGTHVDISQRKAAELELARAHGQLSGILDSATEIAIIAVDPSGLILTFNIGAERMLGYAAAELVGSASIESLHLWHEVQARSQTLARDLGRPVVGFEALVARAVELNEHEAGEWTYVRRDGSHLTVNLIVTAIRDPYGVLIGFLCVAMDVSEEKRIREILQGRDRLLEKLTLWLPGAIYQLCREPDGRCRFLYASAGLRDVYEVSPEEVREDAAPAFARIHPEDRERFHAALEQSALEQTLWREDYRVVLPRQGLRWLRGQAAPERQGDGSVLWHGYLADITGLKQVEQELRALSITDPLTGVYNRRFFNERLETEIARAHRHAGALSLVMLDIDHFKRINDEFGHSAGDLVLRTLCQRLGERLRRIDSLCRLGGEEFIVLCPDTDSAQARILAEALRQAIRREPVEGVGHISASFGVASWREGETADALLRRVDAAVYAAKQAGRDRVAPETA
ncbi:diguanylate cyclase [Pseudomonas sp. RIT-PI-AD]|uniref:sensor domain-containing diguanylate cyclase n=1 Tax=Pseudomonas sp. RIT-PI-AD TaxID=3035294 RepID=UPI0021DB7FA5|nr:diguanylate cyclase [Pseudomonas sp. RIT-PI-AD]